jgi:hypothetical protein
LLAFLVSYALVGALDYRGLARCCLLAFLVSYALVGAMPACYICKATAEGKGWCLDCNSTKSRLTRLFCSCPTLKKEFNPDVSMTHLYDKAKGLPGDDLKAAVTDSLKHTSTSAKESVVKGDGDYMDEEDLIEKYKSKGK